MSVVFHCDGCDDTAPPGTVTGGFPGNWTLSYQYRTKVGGAKVCVGILHHCATCREAGKDRRQECVGDAPTPSAKPKPKARRRRAAKPTTKPEPPDGGQGGLF